MVTSSLAGPPRSHPPPLYYLPAILTPEQEAFINKRKEAVASLVSTEWSAFVKERAAGIEEIAQLRRKAAEESKALKAAREEDASMEVDPPSVPDEKREKEAEKEADKEAEKEAAEVKEKEKEEEKPEEKDADMDVGMNIASGDDDDAVEY